MGSAKALEFFSGYVIEKSLSVDNLFVFLMIFSYFGVKGQHQARILKWGIIGALVMRAIFIFVGIELWSVFRGYSTSSAHCWLSPPSGWPLAKREPLNREII